MSGRVKLHERPLGDGERSGLRAMRAFNRHPFVRLLIVHGVGTQLVVQGARSGTAMVAMVGSIVYCLVGMTWGVDKADRFHMHARAATEETP